MKFEIFATDNKSRAGLLSLPHGEVKTPVFMPVGTVGTVKTLSAPEVDELGFSIILSNTYHLYLRPGLNTIIYYGGLREFTGWKKNFLTDSGGFQIYSLKTLRQIEDQGVWFRSHIDGSPHFFTPESVVEFQYRIGSNIIMPLDICREEVSDKKQAASDMEMTIKWAKKSIDYLKFMDRSGLWDFHPVLFPIVQGNMFPDLRKQSIAKTLEIDAPGYAIGGLSVGEEKDTMYDLTDLSCQELPFDKPRYLMGVGEPADVVECVKRGVDMFDCVFPTRVARNATVFTRKGRLLLRKKHLALENYPIEEDCQCFTCRNFSRGYLRHLFITKEYTAPRLATIHNLYFMKKLMDDIYDSIIEHRFNSFADNFLQEYKSRDVQINKEE